MGPRAKRRLAHIAIAALIIAAGVTAFLLTRSGSSSPGRSSKAGPSSKEVYGTFGAFSIVSGMHANEVTALLGEPDQKRNSCWVYRIHGETFHGIKVIPQIAGMDAVRYCFYAGVVAMIEDHWRNGTYDPQIGPWQAPVTYGCGNGPCKHQAP